MNCHWLCCRSPCAILIQEMTLATFTGTMDVSKNEKTKLARFLNFCSVSVSFQIGLK